MAIIKNSFLNLTGILVPTIFSIPAIGYMARELGTELFGVYTIALALVGYSSIFDVGLTRALVREVSINRDNENLLDKVFSTATIVVFCISVIGSLVIYLNVGHIVDWLNVSRVHQDEICSAIKVLSFTIPLFLLNQIWLALPEGKENFKFLNIQRILSSIFTAVIPVLFIMLNSNLLAAMQGLALGRILSLIICYLSLRNDINRAGIYFDKKSLVKLVSFGGWLTVSNIISPVMVYFDRFIVSNIMGAKNVAFYAAPAEAVMRLSMLPGALARAIFPRLSRAKSISNYNSDLRLSIIIISMALLPLVIFIFSMSKWLMITWMGNEYGGVASYILKILIVGYFFNSLAQIPFTSIQALGKAKITAIIHVFEVLPYLLLLYFCVVNYGIIGAAVAWTIRVTIDCFLLFIINYVISNKLMFKMA
ncbi:flippase [Citrobacter portucalensis]|uniref:flippase n=1 Tax=Citrobacter portucalensis TaxID=1639133 RepID=UPI0018ABA330|nr:flippase [Citrobacter portucalensis]UKK90265.1 flippase [Citrobacter portucalensis]